MNVLTSGTLSGMGRHLQETLGGIGWTRQLALDQRRQVKDQGVDVIIHCAFNSRRSVDSTELYGYLADNVLLTEELVSVPHRKFVFLSSVDVYPRHLDLCSEDDAIDLNAVEGIYGVSKLMSESIVRQNCPDYLILRCVSLLGRHTRNNSLVSIIEDDPCSLGLSGDSCFNYVLHTEVSDLISYAMKNDIQGIVNVACRENIELRAAAAMLEKQVEFGNCRYDVGNVDNTKIASLRPTFGKTSQTTILQFIKQQGRK